MITDPSTARGSISTRISEKTGLLREEGRPSREREAYNAKQCALAVEELHIGREIKRHDDARPGDFVQLWRTNKSGHSVVLVALERDGDRVIGVRYRSSQKSTDGIGDRVEYFADVDGREGGLDRKRIYVARLDPASP